MDYTVEFDSELLEQFPQQVHLAYKKTISKKVIEHVDHNFFRIKPVRTRSAKGIYEICLLYTSRCESIHITILCMKSIL
ncbi:hypothetical protein A5836_002541 [Enterococcus faecium]|nr:hypothetical protein A5836_002541 [Enterococcus faecium]